MDFLKWGKRLAVVSLWLGFCGIVLGFLLEHPDVAGALGIPADGSVLRGESFAILGFSLVIGILAEIGLAVRAAPRRDPGEG